MSATRWWTQKMNLWRALFPSPYIRTVTPHPNPSQQRRASGAELPQPVSKFAVRQVPWNGAVRSLAIVGGRKKPARKIRGETHVKLGEKIGHVSFIVRQRSPSGSIYIYLCRRANVKKCSLAKIGSEMGNSWCAGRVQQAAQSHCKYLVTRI